jgi:hypothetical protein
VCSARLVPAFERVAGFYADGLRVTAVDESRRGQTDICGAAESVPGTRYQRGGLLGGAYRLE